MNSCAKNGGAIYEKPEGGMFKHPPARRGLRILSENTLLKATTGKLLNLGMPTYIYTTIASLPFYVIPDVHHPSLFIVLTHHI